MKRNISIGIGVVALIVLIVLVRKFTAGKDAESIKVPVQFGDFEIMVTTTGELQAENNEYVSGPTGLRNIGIWQIKITDLIDEGTVVDSGEYVGTLDRTEIASKLKDLETEVQQAESQYTQAKLDTTLELTAAREEILNLQYAKEEHKLILEQSKYEPPATIRQAEIQLDKSNRAYDQAIDNYDLKKQKAVAKVKEIYSSLTLKYSKRGQLMEMLGACDVYAPRAGMIIYFKDWDGSKRKVGSQISVWDPFIAQIPDMSQMISMTNVSEVDVSKVKVGQPVTIKVDALPGKKLDGEVIEVSNVGEKKQGTGIKVFDVRIRVNGTDNEIKPSMTTSNQIVCDVIADMMFVPLECIQHEDSITYVFTDDGRKHEVLTGLSNENHVIIISGLEKEDHVYLSIPEGRGDEEIERLDPKIVADYKAKLKKEAEEKNKVPSDSLDFENMDWEKMMKDPEKMKQMMKNMDPKKMKDFKPKGKGGMNVVIEKK